MRLKEWLKLQNIKQKELASRLGVSQGYLSGLLRGQYYPGPNMTARIRIATDSKVTADDLFDEWNERAGTASTKSE